jgi:hypothetical protein
MERVLLVGTMQSLTSEAQDHNGAEVALPLQFFFLYSQFFIPGIRWDPRAHAGLVFGYAALMCLSAVFSGLLCFLLARRYSFSPIERIGWALCGLLFGLVGLLLLLTVREWPVHIACCRCGKHRIVTRDACEHCGAPHASPAVDGTEIFDSCSSPSETWNESTDLERVS